MIAKALLNLPSCASVQRKNADAYKRRLQLVPCHSPCIAMRTAAAVPGEAPPYFKQQC
eukprot:IDg5997t1